MQTEILDQRYKAVIFDIGGVLASDIWEPMLLSRNGFSYYHNLDADIVERTGRRLWQKYVTIGARTREDVGRLENSYWRDLLKLLEVSDSIERLVEETNRFVRPVASTINLLDRLKSNNTELAICSNNTDSSANTVPNGIKSNNNNIFINFNFFTC